KRHGDAHADLERALAIDERQLGTRHPLTLAIMNNLALATHDDGSREPAIKLLERVLELSRESFGPEHPETMSAMVNLAMILEDRRPERALELAFESLSTTRRMLERQISVLSEVDRFTWAAMQRFSLDLVLTLTARHPRLVEPAAIYGEIAAW